MIEELIASMRPKQWYKNLVLFIGIFFSGNFLNFHMWTYVFLAFLIFCIISGSEYIINDLMDREMDRLHPKKCNRPIASGRLKALPALILVTFMLCGALVGAYLINTLFFITSLAYFLLILLYSLYLKHVAVVDILTISMGFVLRAIAGCLAINVAVSPWLIICAFLLALFLAIGKRRHELILLENNANNHRKALDNFSTKILDEMMTIVTSSLIMSYSLYSFLTNNLLMMITIPIVIYGIFRYVFLVNSKNMGGEPEMLFKDAGMLTCIILWVISITGIVYIK